MNCKSCDRPLAKDTGRFCGPRCERLHEGAGLAGPRRVSASVVRETKPEPIPQGWQHRKKVRFAKYATQCRTCKRMVKPGQRITMWLGKAQHVKCADGGAAA